MKHIENALNELAAMVEDNAVAHGFRPAGRCDDGAAIATFVANEHGEVSELWEAYRAGALHMQCDKDAPLTCGAEELADIIIRALDTARAIGVDIGRAVLTKHAYNVTRPYKHGGKLA